jgi:hypothetical protein
LVHRYLLSSSADIAVLQAICQPGDAANTAAATHSLMSVHTARTKPLLLKAARDSDQCDIPATYLVFFADHGKFSRLAE